MAIINQIGGISTGSLVGLAEGPLSSLFKSKGLPRFSYPLDIGNDPTRMHFVMFEITDIKPLHYTQKNISNVIGGTTEGGVIQNQVQQVKQNGFWNTIQNDVSAGLKQSTNILTNLNTEIQPGTTKTKASIVLYMPDTLAINYNQNYTELSLIDATGGLNRVAGAVGSMTEDLMNGIKNKEGFKNIAASVLEKNQDIGLEFLGNQYNGGSATPLLLKKFGKAINPQLQLIYQGLGFRTFTMEFLFTPKSADEAAQVTAIINTFVYASHPTIPSSESGMYFIPPSIFNISFRMAQTGTFSGVKSALQNAGNNLINGLPLGSIAENKLSGNDQYGLHASVENDRLFKVAQCVLEDVSVDYAPNGWAAFNDGAPVQTRLTLTFKELTINDRTRMENGGVR